MLSISCIDAGPGFFRAAICFVEAIDFPCEISLVFALVVAVEIVALVGIVHGGLVSSSWEVWKSATYWTTLIPWHCSKLSWLVVLKAFIVRSSVVAVVVF